MHPNGAPSTDANGLSDADHLANGRETMNVTSAWATTSGGYGSDLAGTDPDQDGDDDRYAVADESDTYDR